MTNPCLDGSCVDPLCRCKRSAGFNGATQAAHMSYFNGFNAYPSTTAQFTGYMAPTTAAAFYQQDPRFSMNGFGLSLGLGTNASSANAHQSGVRGRKQRILFRPAQIDILEKHFLKNPYVNAQERDRLANITQLSPQQVKIWFQNRRYKTKKDQKDIVAGGNGRDGDSSSPNSHTSGTDSSRARSEDLIKVDAEEPIAPGFPVTNHSFTDLPTDIHNPLYAAQMGYSASSGYCPQGFAFPYQQPYALYPNFVCDPICARIPIAEEAQINENDEQKIEPKVFL